MELPKAIAMLKSVLVLFFSFCFLVGLGQFGPAKEITNIMKNNMGMDIGDIDNDGFTDIVLASFDSSKVIWFKNLGNSYFTNGISITTSLNGPISLELNDYDNDTDLDLIVASKNDNKITLFLNTGTGEFNQAQNISDNADGVEHIVSVDIDSDGDLDVFSASFNDNKLAWYENLGLGLFSPEQIISYSGDGAVFIHLVDVDNDLDSDVLLASQNDDKIAWYENLGAGSFGTEQIISTASDQPEGLITMDVDGDSDLDLFAISYLDSKLVWYENLGGGVFGIEQLILSFNNAKFLSKADLDGDLDDDIIIGSATSSGLYSLENLGGGNFGPLEGPIGTNGCRGFRYFDIDNDGVKDILHASDDLLSWFKNDGFGNFSETNGYRIVSNIYSTAREMDVVDFNQDGFQDIIVCNSGYHHLVYCENINGEFFTQKIVVGSNLGFPSTLDVGDIDNDQDFDIVFASDDYAEIRWIENFNNDSLGDQQLIADVSAVAPNEMHDLHLADIDYDGDLDCIYVLSVSDNLCWLENLGGGVYSTGVIISSSCDQPTMIELNDLDNDGLIDIVLASKDDNKIAWYKNLGSGQFSTENIISTNAQGALDVKAADLNNDGLLDVVSSSLNDSKIAWYENLGAGSFGAEQIISITASYPSHLDLIDLNFDGYVDVLVKENIETNWYSNLGNGSFSSKEIISTIDGGYGDVYGRDIDNDGLPDIVSMELESDAKVVWHENQLGYITQIWGNIFVDINENLILDSVDVGVNMIPVISTPSNLYSYTFTSGDYFMNFIDSNVTYTIEPQLPQYWSIVTDSVSYQVVVDSLFNNLDSLNFGIFPDTLIDKVECNLVGDFASCNQNRNYWLHFSNVGTTVASGVVHLELDDSLTFINSQVMPDSIIDQNIYWGYNDLMYFADELILIQVQMPGVNNLNDTISSYLTVNVVDSLGNEIFSVTDTLDQVLSCAYDPNDKISDPIGIDSSGYIPINTSSIDYTIRFQNTGTDTAYNVVVKDQLDPNLDWQSFNFKASSHPVQIQIDANGEASFTFKDILLPDSNVNELASHGFIKYKIDLNPGLPAGTLIENTAEIYFDLNPAIITNTKVNTLYDCYSILSGTTTSQAICENDFLLGQVATAPSNINIEWNLNGVDTINTQQLNWYADTSGTFNLVVSTNTTFCSLDTLFQINILESPSIIDSISICGGDSILIFNQYQSSSGTFYDSLQAINGCDSILMTQLNVLDLPIVNFGQPSQDSVCTYSNVINLNSTPTGGNYSGPGITGNQFDPNLAGEGSHTIYYSYTDSNGCTGIDSTQIFVSGCLGIEGNKNLQITIYPNPFNDYTTIYFGQELNGEYSLYILDANGKKVYINENISGDVLKIDREKLNSGVYILSLIDNRSKEKVFNTRLVIE